MSKIVILVASAIFLISCTKETVVNNTGGELKPGIPVTGGGEASPDSFSPYAY